MRAEISFAHAHRGATGVFAELHAFVVRVPGQEMVSVYLKSRYETLRVGGHDEQSYGDSFPNYLVLLLVARFDIFRDGIPGWENRPVETKRRDAG